MERDASFAAKSAISLHQRISRLSSTMKQRHRDIAAGLGLATNRPLKNSRFTFTTKWKKHTTAIVKLSPGFPHPPNLWHWMLSKLVNFRACCVKQCRLVLKIEVFHSGACPETTNTHMRAQFTIIIFVVKPLCRSFVLFELKLMGFADTSWILLAKYSQ